MLLSPLIENKTDLKWIAPSYKNNQIMFQQQVNDFEMLLKLGPLEKVYSIENERKNVYKGKIPSLGWVAIKEIRFKGVLKRFRRRYFKKNAVLHEFRTGTKFYARGGNTPAFWGVALDQTIWGLKRILLFIEWIENSITLAEYIKEGGGDPGKRFWEKLAVSMVNDARKGLVHNGHSPYNIIVKEDNKEIGFYTIDFAHSQLFDKMNEDGFVNDVVRIIKRMMSDRICDQKNIQEFIDQLARIAWKSPEHEVFYKRIKNEINNAT